MQDATPTNIADRRELFVDDTLIERFGGCASLRMHPPQREEVVFEATPPYENGASLVYSTLLEHNGKYLLYYRGNYDFAEGDEGVVQTVNVAMSSDGIRFERPELGLLDFDDGGRNNALWQGVEGHNFVPFVDTNPACREDERFKAVGGTRPNDLRALVSPDGIHWRRAQEHPLAVPGKFDSANVPLWDPVIGKYRLFSRRAVEVAGGRRRRIMRRRIIQSCVSDDFLHWSEPQPHRYEAKVPAEQLYTNATICCPGAEHILLSFPMRYWIDRPTPVEDISAMQYPGNPDNAGVTDAAIMSSRDGVHWKRPFLEAWLRPGPEPRNWTHRNTCPAIGVLPLRDDQWSMYLSEHYAWPDSRLRRLSLRPWGFASIHAGYHGGEVLTSPLTFTGARLRINFATSAFGHVRVEVQDENGWPIPGFAAHEMPPLYGDRLDHPCAWADPPPLAELAGRPVRLRFELKDADVYAFRFTD